MTHDTKDNSVLFASDLHIGHMLAARNRGFDSVDEHDKNVVDTLAEQCDKRTILWILGDVCMDIKKMHTLRAIPGRKKLVRGNHDQFKMAVYANIFEEIHGFTRYKEMWLSHCPIHPQEMYRCKANVHGHLHKNTNSPELPFPYINVNWDYWSRAVALNELRNIIEENTNDT